MTDLDSSPAPRRGAAGLRAVAVLVLLAVVGGAAWLAVRHGARALDAYSAQRDLVARLDREVAALHEQSRALEERHTRLSGSLLGEDGALGDLRARVDGNEMQLARLSESVEGGRQRLQLAAVEELMLLANDRLRLAADPVSARVALEQADQRLAALRDPRWHEVRAALAQERAALAAVPQADRAGAALALAEIARRAPDFPLRAAVPERFEPAATEAPAVAPEGWPQRVWAAVRAALASMFALRRVDGPPPRLLAPQQEALVAQVLQLKIEGARLALMAGDARTFADLASSASAWLADHYHPGDAGVQAARGDLERLRSLDLSPPLPDISRSLALLRAQRPQ